MSALAAAVELGADADAELLAVELLSLSVELPPACPEEHPTAKVISIANAATNDATRHFLFISITSLVKSTS